MMDPPELLTSRTASSLLQPQNNGVFRSAEDKHAWARVWSPGIRAMFPGSVLDELYDCPLMRTFDMRSGSYPGKDRRMLARAPRLRLDNEQVRIEALTMHVDHRVRKATPCISFTKSPEKLRNLAELRNTRHRGDQRIVVIDPRLRINLGLPVLSYREEAAYYNIKARYSLDYLQDHYLCLWEVTPDEVVGTWSWSDLRGTERWYQDIIVPALQQHRLNQAQSINNGHQINDDDHDTDTDHEEDTSDTSDDTDSNDFANHITTSDSETEACDDQQTGQLIRMYGDLSISWRQS